MKNIQIAAVFIASALVACGQGTINFSDKLNGSYVTHVYSPDSINPATQISGNTVGDTPSGTQTYPNSVLLGGASTGAATTTDYANGNLWSVQIYALPGDNATGALQPVTQYVTTMQTVASQGRTGTFAGFTPTGDQGIPNTCITNSGGTTTQNSATVSLYVWYNGGTSLTYVQSVADGFPAGHSPSVNVDNLGGTITVSGNPAALPPALGIPSFSLTTTPEPSTIALGVLGASAFLVRRRKS